MTLPLLQATKATVRGVIRISAAPEVACPALGPRNGLLQSVHVSPEGRPDRRQVMRWLMLGAYFSLPRGKMASSPGSYHCKGSTEKQRFQDGGLAAGILLYCSLSVARRLGAAEMCPLGSRQKPGVSMTCTPSSIYFYRMHNHAWVWVPRPGPPAGKAAALLVVCSSMTWPGWSPATPPVALGNSISVPILVVFVLPFFFMVMAPIPNLIWAWGHYRVP